MNFRKSSEGVGRVIFNPKVHVAYFAIIDDTSVMNFRKNLQHNFPKNEGGGSMAVWNFSENSSVLEGERVPKSDTMSGQFCTLTMFFLLCICYTWMVLHSVSNFSSQTFLVRVSKPLVSHRSSPPSALWIKGSVKKSLFLWSLVNLALKFDS